MAKYYGKQIIARYAKRLDNEDFEVLVLDDGEYYNIHVISEEFKDEELNTLCLQEPKEDLANVEKVVTADDVAKYFDKARLIGYLMNHFIASRFYDVGIYTGNVDVSFDPHE